MKYRINYTSLSTMEILSLQTRNAVYVKVSALLSMVHQAVLYHRHTFHCDVRSPVKINIL